jgi:hypothetical protein|tara:strand:+ start:740 stop:1111 length:372 start_codon:yes stop_codon:yes gene_type:complete
MAVMQSRDNRTFIAGEDLSAAQFKFVTLESDGQVDLADAAGENAMGVCLVGGTAGNAVTVCVSGSVMITAGGTVAAGASLQTDASGDAITAASGDVVLGYAREAGVDGQIIEMEMIQGGNLVA